MATYAKISNKEFTVSERARRQEAEGEKSVIKTNNRKSDEYAALESAYRESFTSATLEGLESELGVLQSEDEVTMSKEDYILWDNAVKEKQQQIDDEKAALVPGQETALANLQAKELEGTEDLTAEIETLTTTITNALCRVLQVNPGIDEFMDADKNIGETDNTEYWENTFKAKRTSFNTYANKHAKGKDPFRKNYATVGGLYDPVRDAFYIESPFPSWVLDEETCQWSAPVAPPYSVTPPETMPDAGDWYWKDDTMEWVDYVYYNPDNKQPYPSWIWNATTGVWEAPVEKPEDVLYYVWVWDEETLTWIKKRW